MAKLSAKVIKPICIKVTTEKVILTNEENTKEYELSKLIKFKGEHYGFILINTVDEIEYEEAYPTQGKLSRVELNEGTISIYEHGKHNPWRFDNNGILIQNPTIDTVYRIELDYPKNKNIERINVYVKK
ncbi:MAG: hypothetical protein J6A17_02265 [Bacilli bacterium]|nr:hypothetical protein [Bacilli bacterium]